MVPPLVLDGLFVLTVAFLLVHELDAVWRREWRFFVARFGVSEERGQRLFVALHVPLFVAVLWFAESPTFRPVLGVFAVVHAALHVALRTHPLLDFSGWSSWLWILGAAALGGTSLVVSLAL